MSRYSLLMDKMVRRPNLSTAFIVSVCLIFLALTWKGVDNERKNLAQSEASFIAERSASYLTHHISSQISAIKHLAHILSLKNLDLVNNNDDRKYFYDEAMRLHVLFDDYFAINWVNADGIIKFVTPHERNISALGLDIKTLPLAFSALKASRDNKGLFLTEPITLKQGGYGLASYIPVHNEGG